MRTTEHAFVREGARATPDVAGVAAAVLAARLGARPGRGGLHQHAGQEVALRRRGLVNCVQGFALYFESGVGYDKWSFFGGSSSLNRPARGSRPTLSWCWQRTRLEAGCWLLVEEYSHAEEQEQNPSLTVAYGAALRNYYREPTSTPRPRWRRPCRPRPRRRRAGAARARDGRRRRSRSPE